jgi:hypothetical protein
MSGLTTGATAARLKALIRLSVRNDWHGPEAKESAPWPALASAAASIEVSDGVAGATTERRLILP